MKSCYGTAVENDLAFAVAELRLVGTDVNDQVVNTLYGMSETLHVEQLGSVIGIFGAVAWQSIRSRVAAGDVGVGSIIKGPACGGAEDAGSAARPGGGPAA